MLRSSCLCRRELEMKYRDVITTILVLGFFLSLAYTLGVSSSVWWWIAPIGFGVALLLAIYYLWLT
jgi:NhaP-type Na+/H+ or K+/H+ antiporter